MYSILGIGRRVFVISFFVTSLTARWTSEVPCKELSCQTVPKAPCPIFLFLRHKVGLSGLKVDVLGNSVEVPDVGSSHIVSLKRWMVPGSPLERGFLLKLVVSMCGFVFARCHCRLYSSKKPRCTEVSTSTRLRWGKYPSISTQIQQTQQRDVWIYGRTSICGIPQERQDAQEVWAYASVGAYTEEVRFINQQS